MAAVVVYALQGNKPIFFLGKESHFLSDFLGKDTTRALEQHAFEKPVSFETMKRHFTSVAQTQSEKLGFRVQYDTPHQDPVTHIAKTHLRYLPTSGVKYGVVKGGMELVDKGDTVKTALREFNEECMNIPIKPNAFQKAKTHFPANETPLKGRDLFFLNVTSMLPLLETTRMGRQADHYGELFDSEMKPYEDVCKVRNKLNYPSRYAIEVFMREMKVPSCPPKGGLLRRRKTHRRTLARNTPNQ
jgi:hypothetical protein